MLKCEVVSPGPSGDKGGQLRKGQGKLMKPEPPPRVRSPAGSEAGARRKGRLVANPW